MLYNGEDVTGRIFAIIHHHGAGRDGPRLSNSSPNTKTKLRGFSPQANSTDWETAACRRSFVPTFADRECCVVSAVDPHGS
jgi:hypothetical protein